jgi:hypothetical protein
LLFCCFSALLFSMPPSGPSCPACGYPIFGLRDMRCPECGRALDVRDFAIDRDESSAIQKKLRRDGRIGITAGLILLLIPGALVALLAYAFISYNRVPPCTVIAALVFFAVWIWRVLAWIGNEAMPSKRRRR